MSVPVRKSISESGALSCWRRVDGVEALFSKGERFDLCTGRHVQQRDQRTELSPRDPATSVGVEHGTQRLDIVVCACYLFGEGHLFSRSCRYVVRLARTLNSGVTVVPEPILETRTEPPT